MRLAASFNPFSGSVHWFPRPTISKFCTKSAQSVLRPQYFSRTRAFRGFRSVGGLGARGGSCRSRRTSSNSRLISSGASVLAGCRRGDASAPREGASGRATVRRGLQPLACSFLSGSESGGRPLSVAQGEVLVYSQGFVASSSNESADELEDERRWSSSPAVF